LSFFVENLDKLEFKDGQEKGKEKAKVAGFVFFSGNKSVLSQQAVVKVCVSGENYSSRA